MRLLKQLLRSKLKPLTAMFLTFVMLFGAMPLNVFAYGIVSSDPPLIIVEAEPFIARIDGEEVLVPPDGIVTMDVVGFDEPLEIEVPRYIYLDGEKIPIDHERVENIAPVLTSASPFSSLSLTEDDYSPSVGFIISISATVPSNPVVSEIGQEYTHPAYVRMNSRTVSSRRYVVVINRVEYEAFCANPNLPGPESNNAVYELTDADGERFRTVLRYGFPINPALSNPELSDDDRAWNVYMTRVAIAYVGNPNATWTNITGGTRLAVDNRINGVGGATAKANLPAISVNDVIDYIDVGEIPQSSSFVLGTGRRTNCQRNPFRFEWEQGTPAGTRLYVDGSYVVTAPTNPTTTFTVRPGGGFTTASEFHFIMPAGSEGQTARVNLVGINNQYAGRVFVMQNPNDTESWQDIVFYIPEAFASASFTWDYEPFEEEHGRLRIIKTDIEGNNLAGAVFSIDGPDPSMPITDIVVPVGGWTSGPLELGSYTITEVTPPSGFTLSSNPTRTVTVTADNTTQAPAIVTFANERILTNGNGYENGVTIQKINAITGDNIPGAVIRLRGIDNPTIDVTQVLTEGATTAMPEGITSTVTNGVWRIEGLPPGAFEAIEIQAPDGFSMLPGPNAHAFVKQAGSDAHIMLTFRNYPFGRVELQKVEGANGIAGNNPLPGATFRIEGFYPGTPTRPLLRYAQTDANGRIVWDELPAGQFTITEVMPPSGYTFGSVTTWSVSVGWGQTVEIIAYNVPKSYLEIEKICYITGEYLAGAVFELRDPTTGETWSATTGSNGRVVIGQGSYGSYLYPGRTYILTELRSPTGYMIISGPWDVVLSPGGNHIVIENFPYSEIVVYKREMSNGVGNNQLLPGATFRIRGYYPGPPSRPLDRTAVTDENGRIVFGNLPAGSFTISEVMPPSGYTFGPETYWVVTVGWGQTVAAGTAQIITVFNIPKSSLEILKVCGVTGEPLEGAIFEIEDPATSERWQATSDSNGIALLGRGTYGNFLYPGRTYIIREIRAPYGFVLQDGSREIVLSPGNENRITWENFRNPGLTIIKQCQDTGEYLAGAHFTVVAQGSGRPLPIDFPLITDENGRIFVPWTLFSGESERNFIVTETVPPPGFELSNPNWQLVTMQAGYPNTVVFANRRSPALTIQKRDAVTGEPIQNAEFTIERLSPAPTGMITGNPFRTDAQGRIVLPDLPVGVYRVVETRAANNFWLDPLAQNRTWVIEIRPNEDYLLIVENTMLPTLVITKWNMVTMQPVPLTHFRVEFEVPNSGNVVRVGDFVTDRNGQIILPFVQPGWYRITEIFPAPGMSLNVNNNYRIFLSPGDNTYRLLDYLRSAGWMGPAYSDADVGDIDTNPNPPPAPNPNPPLPDPQPVDFPFTPAEWEAMSYSARQQFLQSQISVTDGSQWLAPGGQNIFNWPLNSIVIKKSCSVTGRLLPGATFNLIHTSAGVSGTLGTVIGTFTTGPSGVIVITGLVPGSYVVREEQPPQHFTLSVNNTQTAFLAPDGHSVVELNFANDPYGSLLITKRCEVTHRPLQHAEFRVTRSDGSVVGTVNGLHTTNAQGYILIPNLPPDSYVVTEMRAPDGFQIDRIPQTIRVNATGNTYQVNFTNVPYSSLIIRKLDSYNMTPLPGARFDVRHSNGEWIGEFITDSNGLIEIQGILGWVTITETDPPPGFALDPNPTRTVQVGPRAPTVVTFLNPRLGSLTIEKTDQFGAPLSGARFRVTHQNGQLVGYYTTSASGMINISNLPSGWFFVEEVQAPQGFVISEAGRSVEVNTNSVAHVTFVNLAYPSLSIVKVDQDGNPLAGARFRVSAIGGAFREYVTTGQGGLASLTLPVGTFEIVEVQAPPGFIITEPARTIIARAGEHRIETFVNHRIPGLIIEKVDTESNPLQGAEFEIRRMDGGLVQRVTTNSGGIATVAQIEPGTFQVVESRAPDGFVLDSVAQIVTVTPGETATLRFVNHRQPSLVIEKVDTEGNPLSGAEFEIRTLDGGLVHRGTTNQGGMLIVTGLEPGVLEITETRAPAGFVITEPSRVVQIAAGQTLTERFINHRSPSLIIEKVDENGAPLAGAEFEVRRLNGELVHRVTTDNGGLAIIDSLAPGAYQIIETRAPEGFVIVEPSRSIEIVAGETRTERFINPRLATFVIRKIDGTSGQPLQGVIFEISTLAGEQVRNPANGSFEFVTDAAGLIRLPMLPAGSYVATETRALPGYIPAEPLVFIVGHDRDYIITVRNYKMPTYVIRKLCGDTDRPLQGVVFEIAHYFGNGNAGERIRNPVDGSFEFVTDAAGLIYIPSLPRGTFVAIETRALPGYALADPVVFVVGDNQNTTIIIRNYKQPSVVIRKICGDTGRPLAGVEFEIAVYLGNGRTGQRLKNYAVDNSYTFTTDASGHIYLPTLPDGKYIAIETRPLPGFRLAAPVTFTVGVNGDHTVIIRNFRYADFAILKIDGDTNQPLAGVEFEIAHYLGSGRNGERLVNPANNTTTFVTDAAGMIHLPTIAPGMYVAIETRALPGFSLAAPEIFIVPDTAGAPQDRVVTIRNFRIADFVIRKTDGDTGRPLAGVHFEIARYFGSGQAGERLRNPVDGSTTFITDAAGLIRLPNLQPGTYVAIETRALDGFILADPVIFVVGERAENTTIDIQNFRAPNLTIRKINSVTRQPIQGVVFQLARISGERVTNPATGFFDFTTDRNGLIHLPAIEDGTFLVTEIRAAQGYFGLDEAVVLQIDSQTRQQDYLLVIENTPASGLLILKTCANTGRPLQGVEFEVRHADGRLVRGLMADQNQPGTHANSPNIAPNGNFLTDHRGMIHLNHLEAGVYHITETRALPGFQLDSTVHVVTITPGRLTTLEVENVQMAGLRLLKIDSVTRQGIPGVEFRIFDFITNQEVAGPFVTDNNGVIDFTGILPPGRYTIRETREAPGYLRDTMPRTVEFRAGMVTEIVWENTREAGQIQITKLSSADNEVNGLPAGSRLAGAVFEVRDWRTGNVVDQFITDARGVGVSRPLPLGRYLIEEIVAPPFYRRSDVVLDVTIEHSGQILRYQFFNEPANVGVEVRKTGPVEVMPGQPIVWNITTIANASTIDLSDFFVRDILPAHAVRLDRIFTGTFNQSVRYSIMFRTNLNDTWRVAYDNLSSTTNNALAMSPAALGLRSNEFVTEFMFSFGTVRAGFRSVEAPRIEGTVRDGLQSGYEFANRVDIGGRTGSEWVIGNNVWITRVWRPTEGNHPRTGW